MHLHTQEIPTRSHFVGKIHCPSNRTPPSEWGIWNTRKFLQVSLTFENRAFIHLVKVFFCTSLCSSVGQKRRERGKVSICTIGKGTKQDHCQPGKLKPALGVQCGEAQWWTAREEWFDSSQRSLPTPPRGGGSHGHLAQRTWLSPPKPKCAVTSY